MQPRLAAINMEYGFTGRILFIVLCRNSYYVCTKPQAHDRMEDELGVSPNDSHCLRQELSVDKWNLAKYDFGFTFKFSGEMPLAQ